MLKLNVRLFRRLLLGSAVAVLVAVFPQLALGQTPGSLAQLSSPNNCIEATNSESTDCPNSTAAGLSGAIDVVSSPDGKNVYVVSFSDDSIAEFSRSASGALSPLGCIVATGASGSTCGGTTATGLDAPEAIAISPDGSNVYVAAQDSHGIGTIAEFSRDAVDGSLSQISATGTPNGCIAENTGQTDGVVSDCTNQTGHGIDHALALAVSPDGQNVYVADASGNDVAAFTRNADGSLSQLNGSENCITEQSDGSTDCGTTTGTGLSGVHAVSVSPDGTNVYAGSDSNPGAVAEFARNGDGSLTELGCVQETSDSGECGTAGIGLNDIVSLVVSPDGANVYASSAGTTGSIAEFARNGNGTLSQLASPNDCIAEQGSTEGCGRTNATGLDGAFQLKMSPDGASLYVAANEDDCCSAALAEFARASDGSLAQLAPPDNCLEEGGNECQDNTATGLGGGALDVSPDGANVYVVGLSEVGEFSRVPVLHTLTVSLAGSGSGAVADNTGAIHCPSSCSNAYTANTRVTLSATPSSGSTFAGWSGACSGTGSCQVKMSADMAVSATFTANATPPSPGAPTPVLTGAPTAITDAGAGFSGSVNPEGLPTSVYFQYGLDQRYSQVGASGPNYTLQTPPQTVGADFSVHGVGPVTVAGLVPNALYHVRMVATNSAGTAFGQDVTFSTANAPPPGSPTLGRTFNVAPVSGLVFVLINGHLVPLTQLQQIPAGAVIDALHGTFELVINPGGGAAHDVSAKGKTQSGKFGGAVVRLHQATRGANRGLTTVMMIESAFKGAPSQAICKEPAGDGHAASLSSKTIQLLHASAHGKFSTSGRYSAATVRGTVWTITARCDGTLVHDVTDSVVVTDFVRHKTIVLHAGQSYLAPGPRKK